MTPCACKLVMSDLTAVASARPSHELRYMLSFMSPRRRLPVGDHSWRSQALTVAPWAAAPSYTPSTKRGVPRISTRLPSSTATLIAALAPAGTFDTRNGGYV